MNVPALGARRYATLAMLLLAALTLSGCQLPRSGPMLSEMTGAHDDKDVIVMPVSRELAQKELRQSAPIQIFFARFSELFAIPR